jgi:aryl-alcohol dehydrogenase-like predicted oxidoreductase
MRMSTEEPRDEELLVETVAAAAAAGVTVFDTAHAYGHGEADLGHNERLLARALRQGGAASVARVVTKGGMTRPGGGWLADGRAKAIAGDCETSLAALDGLPIDLYLLHAPDPRTPWQTSVRALSQLLDQGLVRRVGLSNVNRGQLDEALALAPIAAVEVALSPYDDTAIRGGILERCAELGIALIAHSPLGGPRRAKRLGRLAPLAELAAARRATAAELTLGWLLHLSPVVIPIPGARRPDTARSAAHAATLALDEGELARLGRAFGAARPARAARPRRSGEVVAVMGIPGAGKSVVAGDYVGRGYVRLNRDERGGSLRALARELDDELAAGVECVVLDNTYLTRAARSHALDAAARHGVAARCIWVDTPLAHAQLNLVERLLDRFGELPTPEQLRALSRAEPGLLMPTSQMRAARELEPPSMDEGWTAIERVPFVRTQRGSRPGVFVAAGAVPADWRPQRDADAPHLVFDWNPDGSRDLLDAAAARVASRVSGLVQSALCPHAAGPPRCWCRPPLPGLAVAFARAHDVDLSRSIVIGTGPAHRTLAGALGASYIGA